MKISAKSVMAKIKRRMATTARKYGENRRNISQWRENISLSLKKMANG
jgi:ABC-type phosphonate transport system ATPase subunit